MQRSPGTITHRRKGGLLEAVDQRLTSRFDVRVLAVSELTGAPSYLIRLLVLIEDKRFWIHSGTDPVAILRAAYMGILRSGALQGGSTISEQLVKIRSTFTRRTLFQRAVRMGLSLRLEMNKSKVEVLREYLDSVYLGRNAIGFGAAALRYFGKPLCDLTRAEAFFLAERVALPAGFRPGRIRNILSRPRVRQELGSEIFDLPEVYLQAFSTGSATEMRWVLDQVLGEQDAR